MSADKRLILALGTTPTLQRTMRFGDLRVGQVNRATSVAEYASGKPINVARVAVTLGCPARVLIPLGGDRGAAVRKDMAAAGIENDAVESGVPTRLCITAIDDSGPAATELVEEHASLPAAVGDRLLEHLDRWLAKARFLVLTGSLAAGIKADFYASAIHSARRRGVTTLLDASGEPLLEALPERPDIVKINSAELSQTLGRPADSPETVSAAMGELQGRFGGWLVVTDGAAGSFARNDTDSWRLNTPPVRALSPIGSGDAFAAGIAAAVGEGMDIPAACRFGAACGAANALSPYAGHLDASRIGELLAGITLAPLHEAP